MYACGNMCKYVRKYERKIKLKNEQICTSHI